MKGIGEVYSIYTTVMQRAPVIIRIFFVTDVVQINIRMSFFLESVYDVRIICIKDVSLFGSQEKRCHLFSVPFKFLNCMVTFKEF